MAIAVNLYDSLIDLLSSLRTDSEFEEKEKKAKDLSKCYDYKQSRKRVYPKLFPDDPTSTDCYDNQGPSFQFKTQTYYKILDTLINELQRRRQAYSEFYDKFSVFHGYSKMSNEEIRAKALQLAECYSEINRELSDSEELAHFLHFASTTKCSSPQDMLKSIRDHKLSATYPNTDIALRIFLCNFGTNVTGERTFSTLKRIKNELRTSTSQSRMSALSLLCIEDDIVQSMSFDDIIDEFSRRKARKMPVL